MLRDLFYSLNPNTGNYMTEPDYEHPSSPDYQDKEPIIIYDDVIFILYDDENEKHCYKALLKYWDSSEYRHVIVNYIPLIAKEMADNCPILIADVLEEAVKNEYGNHCVINVDVW